MCNVGWIPLDDKWHCANRCGGKSDVEALIAPANLWSPRSLLCTALLETPCDQMRNYIKTISGAWKQLFPSAAFQVYLCISSVIPPISEQWNPRKQNISFNCDLLSHFCHSVQQIMQTYIFQHENRKGNEYSVHIILMFGDCSEGQLGYRKRIDKLCYINLFIQRWEVPMVISILHWYQLIAASQLKQTASKLARILEIRIAHLGTELYN